MTYDDPTLLDGCEQIITHTGFGCDMIYNKHTLGVMPTRADDYTN